MHYKHVLYVLVQYCTVRTVLYVPRSLANKMGETAGSHEMNPAKGPHFTNTKTQDASLDHAGSETDLVDPKTSR